jgi:hypothetical protein
VDSEIIISIVSVCRRESDLVGNEIAVQVDEGGPEQKQRIPDDVRPDYKDPATCRTKPGDSGLHTKDFI